MPSFATSLPSRGARVEMPVLIAGGIVHDVAPLAGSAGRNHGKPIAVICANVAPLAGSAGRNQMQKSKKCPKLCRSPRGERG